MQNDRDENLKPWQEFGMSQEVMENKSVQVVNEVQDEGGLASDLVVISMAAAMSGLSHMRTSAVYAGDEKIFDAMLDRFHGALEMLRINRE